VSGAGACRAQRTSLCASHRYRNPCCNLKSQVHGRSAQRGLGCTHKSSHKKISAAVPFKRLESGCDKTKGENTITTVTTVNQIASHGHRTTKALAEEVGPAALRLRVSLSATVKPEFRLLLGFLVELLSQTREFFRQPGFERCGQLRPRFSLQLQFLRSGLFIQAALSSHSSTLMLRPLRSTVVTRFLATVGRSDSRPGPLPGVMFSPEALVASPTSPPGLPGSSTDLSSRAVPYHPEGPAAALAPYFAASIRLHPRGRTGHLQVPLTRPNWVRLRYGSRVRLARLRRTNCSVSRSLGYLTNGQLQGKLLSAYKISQAFLAHPRRGGPPQPRPTAWFSKPISVWPQALKGRHNVRGRTRAVAEAGLVVFITPLQGLRSGNGVIFLTQAAGQAAGLGFARPPRLG
jgi:hypothetical protein